MLLLRTYRWAFHLWRTLTERRRRIVEIHVGLPHDDAVEHEIDCSCACGPDVRYVGTDDGRIAPVVFHHRLVPLPLEVDP